MVVCISVEDGLSVQLEVEGAYAPDILDDVVSRARELFRLAAADLAHLDAEHPAE